MSMEISDCGAGEYSRRDFLQAGGTVLAGAALATGLPMAEPSGVVQDLGKKVRIGVVGGGFGCAFQWHEHPNCRVEAVCDLREDRLQNLVKTFGCSKTYTSLDELLKDRNIDAVAVFTGAPDHFRHTVACLKAGKHVICAVPAAMSIAECEELVDTVKETGLTYMMAETSYYSQSAISARKFYQ